MQAIIKYLGNPKILQIKVQVFIQTRPLPLL